MIVVCLLGDSDPQESFKFLLICMLIICGYAIAGHPLLGLGFGTQMPSGTGEVRMITDGHLWECLLEMGIPLFLAMLIFYLTTLRLSIRNRRKPSCRLYCTAYIILLVYYLIIFVFNSALDSRSNMCVLMILLGFVVSSVNNCADPAPKPDDL